MKNGKARSPFHHPSARFSPINPIRAAPESDERPEYLRPSNPFPSDVDADPMSPRLVTSTSADRRISFNVSRT